MKYMLILCCIAAMPVWARAADTDTIEFNHHSIMKMFSPNGDGINDEFRIMELDDIKYMENQLQIFDRYGNLVFEQRSYQNNWQGENLPDGVYIYRLNLWLETKPQPPIMGAVEIRRHKR